MGEQLAGAAHAGLNFVEDQQQAVIVADLAQAPQEVAVAGRTPPSPWIGSIRIAAGLGPDRRARPLQIAERDLVEARRPSGRSRRDISLPAGRERRQRAAMERAFEGDDAETLRMAVRLILAAILMAHFIRLGARIAEEHGVGEGRVPAARPAARPPGIR